MSIIFSGLILVVGAWILASPWVLGYRDSLLLGLTLFSGLATVVCSAIDIKLSRALLAAHSGKAAMGQPASPWQTPQSKAATSDKTTGVTHIKKIRWAVPAIGIFSLIIGIVWTNTPLGWNLVGSGIFILLVGLVVTQINAQPSAFIMSARDGTSLITASQIIYEDDSIIIKGKLLGSMSAETYFRASELWKALSLIPPALLIQLPIFLVKGWQANRRKEK